MNLNESTVQPAKAKRVLAGTLILTAILAACVETATAARPGDPSDNIDFAGSGFVAQASYVPPQLANGIAQAGFLSNGPGLIGAPGWVRQTSCDSCDNYGCESCSMPGGCNGSCGAMGGCNGNCNDDGCGGLLGRLGLVGQGHCMGTLQALRYHIGSINPVAGLAMLRPYQDAGICAQRWYDLSLEGLYLGRTRQDFGIGGVITRQGSGFGGNPVITNDGLDAGDLEEGIRISGAMVFGAGGNLEATYMGGNEWEGVQTAVSPPTFTGVVPTQTLVSGADLFSFITEFGTVPPGGFDDVDRSISQTARSTADFHSGEFNYRRRTMGPFCRFQGSWLFGMRYLRYDNGLGLDIVGLTDDGTLASTSDDVLRFFNGRADVENSLFGAQIGGDLWWNMIPGINVGVEVKGAWLKNDIDSNISLSANSIAAGSPGTFVSSTHEDDGTLAGEFQFKTIYRFSHSWSFRSAYYLIAIEDVALSNLNGQFIRDAVQNNPVNNSLTMGSVVVQGFSFGTEYIW